MKGFGRRKKGRKETLKILPQAETVQNLCKRMAQLGELPENSNETSVQIQGLLTHLYEAEAKVQMEAADLTRYQQVAAAAQQSLEEATNKVRVLDAELQAAQKTAQTVAANAHDAQVKLAEHDQLLFQARQLVNKYSNDIVELESKLSGVKNNGTSYTSTLPDPSSFLSRSPPPIPTQEIIHCFGPNCNRTFKKQNNDYDIDNY